MVFLKAVLLGIVEGLTEFLPISSTGHLILVESYFELGLSDGFTTTFQVAIQLPAILAVVFYFWPRLNPWPRNAERRTRNWRLYPKIVVAVLPAVVLGLLFDDFIEAHLMRPLPVAIALFVGGLVLILIERGRREARVESLEDLGYLTALAIGFFQCLAMLPGTSRSAATIIGAMLLGASRPVAAEFSFFLAIPTMLGATTLTLAKRGANFTSLEWTVLAIGSVVSFAVAYASIAFLMRYIQRHDFRLFGYYRIVLAAIVLLTLALG